MDERILRHLSGELTEIETRSLEKWRQESPENEKQFQEVEQVWNLSGNLELGARETRLELNASPPPLLTAIVTAAESRRQSSSGRASRRAWLSSPWAWAAPAAAAIVMLLLRLPSGVDPTPPVALLAPIESVASAANTVTMSLSEGSVMRLAQGASVDFPPVADRREVVLSGRAFFAVSEGEAPFVVRTAVGQVTVHGTRFEVDAEGEALRLVVVEGTVSLTSSGGSSQVEAGQVAYMSAESAPRVLSHENVWTLLDWPEGMLLFQETPMSDVARDVERRFGRAVVLDPDVADLRVTAWFGEETLEEVVSSLCLLTGARCAVTDDEITIAR